MIEIPTIAVLITSILVTTTILALAMMNSASRASAENWRQAWHNMNTSRQEANTERYKVAAELQAEKEAHEKTHQRYINLYNAMNKVLCNDDRLDNPEKESPT